MLNKKLLAYFGGLVLLMFFIKCAQVVTPTGGPKDEIPPKLLESIPNNYSINFKEKEIELVFDEYIKLDNINQKLLVSPPLKYKPIATLRGKSLLIELEDTLLENTTYTFNFSDAIKDNNEGNPIDGFEFVISTGDKLDSLSVQGVVLDAFTHEPKEEITVMLYDNLNDSVPFSVLPFHLLKTGKDGKFVINNVRNSTYKIFALGDENDNYLFDLPEEKIAFSKEFVNFESRMIEKKDSISPDSVIISQYTKMLADTFKLFLFQEDYKSQYLVSNDRKEYRRLDFIFNRPLYYDSLKIELLNFNRQEEWYWVENNSTMDTISYWITDTLISKLDTISVALNYFVLDSLDEFTWISDTIDLKFDFKKEEDTKSKKKKNRISKRDDKKDSRREGKNRISLKDSDDIVKKDSLSLDTLSIDSLNIQDTIKEVKIEYLKLQLNVKSGAVFDLGKSISIVSPTPFSEINSDKFKLLFIEDSLEFPRDLKLIQDSVHNRRVLLSSELEERSEYKLMIEPEAIKDIYELYNDTTIVPFKTRELEYYGTIILNLSGVKSNMILQLLDSNEKMIRQERVNDSGVIRLLHLPPQEYKLKIIYDSNNNFKWDTGFYKEKLQPEEIKYYKNTINVRSNWDLELNWNLEIN